MNKFIILISLLISLLILLIYSCNNYNDDIFIFIPTQFNDADSEILKYISGKKTNKYINGIINMDYLASKVNLYTVLKSVYNNETLNSILPVTWKTNEITRNDILSGNIYILKKDIQQQKGLYLTDNVNEILELSKNKEYVVVQEFLKDPFIISDTFDNKIVDRKINIRVYIFITIFKGKANFYAYKDGFVYYTPNNFRYSLDLNSMITTGYIARDVYDRNPLTLMDLKEYIGIDKYNNFWNLLKSKLNLVPFSSLWQNDNKDNYHFQIFGCDVEINSTFSDCKILEFNKGPDLTAKDTRDQTLKTKMVKDSNNIVFGGKGLGDFEEIQL